MIRGLRTARGGWAGLIVSSHTERAPDDPLVLVPSAEEAACRGLVERAAKLPRAGRTTLGEAIGWAKSHQPGTFGGVTVSRRLLRPLLEALGDGVEEVEVHIGHLDDVRVVVVVGAAGTLVLGEDRQPYDQAAHFEVTP